MTNAATRTAQYIAQAGSSADLVAGIVTLSTGTGPQEVIDAGLNLYKIVDAFYQLTNNNRVLKALPLLGLGNALRKASLDRSATGSITRANQLGLLGEEANREENRVRSQYCSFKQNPDINACARMAAGQAA